MSVMPYPASEDYEEDTPLAERPRRRWWTPWTAVLLAVLLGAIGFYAGVRVEKGQVGSSTSVASGASGARAGAAGATGRAGGFAARFGGGAGAGAGGTFGTVTAVNGNSLYVTDASGNTVKVTFNTATKVTKSEGVSKKAIRPGDAVVIQGVKGTNGNVAAMSVSDTGARPSTSTSSSTSSSNSASSAVNSLFGGGG